MVELYATLGVCLICSGTIFIALYFNHQWRKSRQKAQQEYIKFWNHMERDLGVDYGTIKEVAGQMKGIEDLEKANKRIKNATH